MSDIVTYERRGPTARIRMDDGRLNLMNVAMLEALHAAFDRAAQEAAMPVLSGRADIFSAGFDLKVLRAGVAAEVHAMLRLGAELALKVLSFPMPVMTVTEGDAFPMGAFLMLAADWRIGTEGAWRVGLNEVRIGMPVPRFGVELARQRLAPAYFNATAVIGQMYGPADAKAAGFLEQVVPAEKLEAAVEGAAKVADAIDLASHRLTKARARGEAIATIRAVIDADITLAFAEETVARRVA